MAFPHWDIVHMQVLSSVPHSFHHLPIGIENGPIPVKVSPIELPFINFAIIPFECAITMHLSELKWTLIFSSLCLHPSVPDFEISWKLSYILSFSSLHVQSAVTFHVSISEWALINFAIRPSEDCIVIIFYAIYKVSFVLRPIRINLYASSVRLIILPKSVIDKVARPRYKPARSLQFTIYNIPSLEWAIRIEINTILASNLTVGEGAFKVGTILKV